MLVLDAPEMKLCARMFVQTLFHENPYAKIHFQTPGLNGFEFKIGIFHENPQAKINFKPVPPVWGI